MKVKQLEWERCENGAIAKIFLTRQNWVGYYIYMNSTEFYCELSFHGFSTNFDYDNAYNSLNKAKLACQAHFEQWVLVLIEEEQEV